MYNASDKSYIQARAIKKGEYKLMPAHQQLVDWVAGQLAINVLDFNCATKETSAGYRQQMIGIIVETTADASQADTPDNETMIGQKFMEYFMLNDPKIKNSDPLKNDIFSMSEKAFPEIIVGFYPLEEIELKVAKEKARKDLGFLEKYKDVVWRGDIDTVFYFTDAQIKENRENGITQSILDEFLKAFKKYDAFGYFGPHSISVVFDSKETFDRDFQGKDWMYYR